MKSPKETVLKCQCYKMVNGPDVLQGLNKYQNNMYECIVIFSDLKCYSVLTLSGIFR